LKSNLFARAVMNQTSLVPGIALAPTATPRTSATTP
jgi:hypothetical protein